MLDNTYRDGRLRVAELLTALDDEQLRTLVPATPRWAVRDVLAHLVGGASDSVTGRVDGAPGERWTARHVAERQRATVETLLDEWQRVGPAIERGLAGVQFTGPNLAADLICHEADLREALDLPRLDHAPWQRPFLDVMMRMVARRLRPLTSVVIRDELGNEWLCGTTQPGIELRVDGYELLRAVFSRRSSGQIAAWDWAPAPTKEVVDSLGLFGPRDDDQPIPLAPR